MSRIPEPQIVTQRSVSPTSSSALNSAVVERFPSFDDQPPNLSLLPVTSTESPQEIGPGQLPGSAPKWPAKKTIQKERDPWRPTGHGHRSRRSISEAINRIRTRTGSVSENAHELAVALKAPVSWKLIALCVMWYTTSALTNTSSKSILNAFPKPVTLTIVQFASVSIWCLIFAYLASIFPGLRKSIPALKNGLRYPTMDVLSTALPLSVFSLLGHLLSSYATSKIPVSLVHTIKGLSPLFTVLAYRLVFRIRYARATYLSLVPLTVGVMMACSTNFSTNFLGIGASFIAAIVFVTQNIFSKKLFSESSRAEAEGQFQQSRKLDKLNLLCYCSVGAFLFTAPVWIFTEGFTIIQDIWNDGAIDLTMKKGAMDHGALTLEFIFNGVFHFGQNILAFVLLSMLSPVSYSVASLIKRVWVIMVAIFWFRSSTTPIQGFGVALTFLGLYLYDRTSMEDAAERRTKTDYFRHKPALLPLTEVHDLPPPNGHISSPRRSTQEPDYNFQGTNSKKDDGNLIRQNDITFSNVWLPPGTKQESTWEPGDAGSPA